MNRSGGTGILPVERGPRREACATDFIREQYPARGRFPPHAKTRSRTRTVPAACSDSPPHSKTRSRTRTVSAACSDSPPHSKTRSRTRTVSAARSDSEPHADALSRLSETGFFRISALQGNFAEVVPPGGRSLLRVIPAQAGIQRGCGSPQSLSQPRGHWMPACAGMTRPRNTTTHGNTPRRSYTLPICSIAAQ